MNKLKNKILCSCLIFILALSSICIAANTEAGANAKVNSNVVTNTETNSNTELENSQIEGLESQIYASDYFATGATINLKELVDGNSFIVGQDVIITGKINGDLFVAGNTVTIDTDAMVYSSLFVVANEVIVKGTVYDIYSMAKKFTLDKSAIVYRDIKLSGDEINISGKVQRNAIISANNLNLPDTDSVLIAGNLNYASSNEMAIPEGSVQGEINYQQINTEKTNIILNYVLRFLSLIIFVLVIVLFLIFIAPKFIDRANYNLIKRPFISSGIGILGVVIIPFICLLLMTQVFTLPLAFTLLGIYVLVLAVSFSIFAIALAKYFATKFKLEKKWQSVLLSILTAIIMFAINLIPTIGTFISMFFSVVGFGVILVSIFNKKSE